MFVLCSQKYLKYEHLPEFKHRDSIVWLICFSLSGDVQGFGLAGIDLFLLFRRSILKVIFEVRGVGI